MSGASQTRAVTDRLRAVLAAPGLPARAARRGQALLTRLEAPVRVGLFGLPGSGKAAAINALAGSDLLPAPLAVPVLVRHADIPTLTATLESGEEAALDWTGGPVTLPDDALYAEIALPAPGLLDRSLLGVAAEAAPEDLGSALAWAAERCDLALWCTHDWTALEAASWDAAPDRLKDHAVLVAMSGAPGGAGDFVGGLCEARLDPATGAMPPEAAARLAERLDALIATARAEDADAAAVFLEQYAPTAPDAAPEPAPAPGTAAQSDPVPLRPVPAAPAAAPCAATARVARLFMQLRETASRLPHDAPDALLAGVETALQSLADTAETDDAIVEAHPALLDTLREAGELSLLLRLEGGPRQATEAARLLGQVRAEFETVLAA